MEVLWEEEKGGVENIYFGLIQKMGRLEDINILWCSKKWDLEKLCSLIRVGSYLLGVGSAPKNKICSEVGFVGVGIGEGGSLRKYLLDCPKK